MFSAWNQSRFSWNGEIARADRIQRQIELLITPEDKVAEATMID
jgi:hypothetical protein